MFPEKTDSGSALSISGKALVIKILAACELRKAILLHSPIH
jgi:hypothetical protein